MTGADMIRVEMERALERERCRHCPHLEFTLGNMRQRLASAGKEGAPELLVEVDGWTARLEEAGEGPMDCEKCGPETAWEITVRTFPLPCSI